MKLHSPQFLSQTLFKFSHLPLQNAAFRPFSVKPDRIRVSKSLVDDEAELSNWVDDLRTGRAETMKPAQRVSSGRETGDREGGFRPRKSSVSRGSGSNFVKRKPNLNSNSNRRFGLSSDDDGGDNEVVERVGSGREPVDRDGGFRPQKSSVSRGSGSNFGKKKPYLNSNSRRRFGLSSDNDDDEEEVVERGKFKGGGGSGSISEFLSEDDVEGETESDDDDEEEEEIVKKSRSVLFGKQNGVSTTPRPVSSGGSDSYLSDSRFDQCSVSPLSLKGIKDAGYEKMTVVQEATLPVILKGKDVLAKAKTGTGKTVAFLLPAIEVVVKSPPTDRDQRRPPIFVLVICPTRELACQAAAEATKLLKYHPTLGVQVVIGGTRLALEQKRMQANPCQILVATPGRLRDHIENTAGFASRLMGVKALVLDEADHLLDMGFRKDIEKIIAAIPKQRQTLMFSATIPDEVRQVCHVALKRDFEYINTVQEGSEDTHAQVRQMHLVAPLDKHFHLLYAILKEHIADDVDYKVLVFCTTAMVTRLVADLLGELNLNVREIHSRKPQSYRTRVSDEFRKSKGLILVTSDVSARGVDYPDVTLVVQVGVPADREQYIHRLGRTGRRGKEGQGILLLAPWEEFFLSTAKDLPIGKAPVPLVDPDTKKKVERALSNVEMKNKEAAYQAWLGYYNSNKKVGKDKYRLVELANEFSRCMGLDTPPAISKLVLGKMGLKNVPGLRSK
ncbi:unnamed protein product [Trifolium pratense]|uniref:Uncharacterized protein n=1 Tax=Trifolium pratense TaxID=57577 RepID=A0ACB0L0X6_TRIPR|nr:unnamed protein product [Trifolium pratense]